MTLDELLQDTTIEQRKWVLARIPATSDAAAARDVGISKNTVCKWPNKANLDAAVLLLLNDSILAAREVLKGNAVTASQELVKLTTDRNKNIRLRAIDSNLNRIDVAGKQQVDVTSGGEKLSAIVVIGGVNLDEI